MANIEVPLRQNTLLESIKGDIEKRLVADQQVLNTLSITDERRYDILDILVKYSQSVPHPGNATSDGNGQDASTLERWQILAYVASVDLTLAKWFESHLDALSILYEIGYAKPVKGLLAVWAAEGHPLRFNPDDTNQQGQVHGTVNGTKAWCSGAHTVDYGLMTYRDKDARSQLLIVDMQQDGIAIDTSSWQAVGMQATDTATIDFDNVAAEQVGAANEYLDRVGFWHGAAGVAACWYGATVCLADYLIKAYQHKPNDFKAMYLGQVSMILAATQQSFYRVARLIDTQPQHSHELAIRQLRAHTEQVARQVLDAAGQALGAAPICGNAHFARVAADLPVFIRQSHGAFDLQKIGELTAQSVSQLRNDSTHKRENIWQL